MARTRAKSGGRSGGRGGGHGGGRGGGRTGTHTKTPAAKKSTRRNEAERENSPHVENENNYEHSDERVVLEPTVREAIADEVYQVIHSTMPEIMAEALKALTEEVQAGKKDTGKTDKGTGKKGKEVETIDTSDEDSDSDSNRKTTKGCNYGAFKRCNPPTFDGTKDAAAAHQWIREMDAVIKISNCSEDQKVKYAAHSFLSEALYWWDNIIQAMGERAIQRMKWDELKRLVIEQFCPQNELDKIEKDFLKLEAGNMTHREYTTKFNEMSRLVPDLVTPESKRIKRYIQGFPANIRRHVNTLKPSTFRSAVELSGMLYDERDEVPLSEPKKKWNNHNNNGKRFQNDDHKYEEKKTKGGEQGSKSGNFEEKRE